MEIKLTFDSPISPSVVQEFLHACDSISYYLKKPKPIDQCLSTIQASFSPRTRTMYQKQVEVVLSTARDHLHRKADRQAALALSSQDHTPTLSRYLSSCLRQFSSCSDLPITTPEEIEEYWAKKWNALIKAGQQHKQDRLASGEPEALINKEITVLQRLATGSWQRETLRTTERLCQWLDIQRLFPNVHFQTPFTVDELDRLTKVHPLLESIPRKDLCCQEFLRQLVSLTPNTDGLLHESVRFMLPYLYPGAFEVVTAIVTDLLRTDSFVDTEGKFLEAVERAVSSSLSSSTCGMALPQLKKDPYLQKCEILPLHIHTALSFATRCQLLERTITPISFANPFFLLNRFSQIELKVHLCQVRSIQFDPIFLLL